VKVGVAGEAGALYMVRVEWRTCTESPSAILIRMRERRCRGGVCRSWLLMPSGTLPRDGDCDLQCPAATSRQVRDYCSVLE